MDECVVCCRRITIYAVGICDHPVCYECSTRMRVLCKQNECPICRQDLPKVVFSRKLQLFSSLSNITYPLDRKYQIYFEDHSCRRAYERLLEHNCRRCYNRNTFNTFGQLKNHMHREHELFYCDLCIENLRIFTSERRCYTREELARHRRIGDKDDTSHRGHPLCEFCDQRYVDNDELFRHLRREHYFCHFCDADGQVNKFYSNYEYLRSHFRREHYLCEEGACREEKFTAAFRSEIDFKAHKAVHHSKNLSKAQAKQARTLELEFTIRPRTSQQRNGSISVTSDGRFRRQERYDNQSRNHHDNQSRNHHDNQSRNHHDSQSRNHHDNQSRNHQPTNNREQGSPRNNSPAERRDHFVAVSKTLDTHSEEQFPCLSSSASAPNTTKVNKTMANSISKDITIKSSKNAKVNHKVNKTIDNDFPALGPSGSQSQNRSASEVLVCNERPISPKPRKTVLFHFNSHNNKKNAAKHSTNVSINVAKPKVSLSVENKPNMTIKTLPQSESSNSVHCTSSNSAKQLVNRRINNNRNNNEQEKTKELIIPVTQDNNIQCNGNNTETPPPYITVKCKSKKKKQKSLWITLEAESEEVQSSEPNKKKKKEPLAIKNNDSLIWEDENKDTNQNNTSDDDSDVTAELEKQTKNLMVNDFPLLPSQSDKVTVPPPGFVSSSITPKVLPPPGFKNNSENSVQTNSVPTVNISLSSVARQLANASPVEDDILSRSEQKELSKYIYSQPPDFQHRNIVLIQQIQKILKENDTSFIEFKTLSGKFRQCQISAEEYHKKCLNILGKDDFLKVIPELLVLLPDINKQQELLNIHTQFCRKQAENSGAIPKGNSWNGLDNNFQFVVCTICQQVLCCNDFQGHATMHSNNSNLLLD